MKGLKYICLFILYPVFLCSAGFLGGVAFIQYFYPGHQAQFKDIRDVGDLSMDLLTDQQNMDKIQDSQKLMTMQEAKEQEQALREQRGDNTEDTRNVISQSELLSADTVYVLEETDLRTDSVVETTWKLPAKYIGMDRESFLEAMDSYETAPPLEELERGFVSLEVISFSKEKVVVQMNYEYALPGSSFYLMVIDNYIVVYQEDLQTVYMDTDILLTDLPDDLQQDIIHVMHIPDEQSLYNFLENYSS